MQFTARNLPIQSVLFATVASAVVAAVAAAAAALALALASGAPRARLRDEPPEASKEEHGWRPVAAVAFAPAGRHPSLQPVGARCARQHPAAGVPEPHLEHPAGQEGDGRAAARADAFDQADKAPLAQEVARGVLRQAARMALEARDEEVAVVLAARFSAKEAPRARVPTVTHNLRRAEGDVSFLKAKPWRCANITPAAPEILRRCNSDLCSQAPIFVAQVFGPLLSVKHHPQLDEEQAVRVRTQELSRNPMKQYFSS